jgi:flagellar hook protein FlgE
MSWYTGISGLNAATANLNTTAHNIANASTTGFKNSRAEFGDVVENNGRGLGVSTQAVNQLFQQGPIVQTGQDGTSGHLDLAVVGNGFFAVKSETGTTPEYTRAGSFYVDTKGNLVNNQGQFLQDESGAAPVNIGAGSVITGFDAVTGTINFKTSAGVQDATGKKVGLSTFPNNQGLKAVGDTNWLETTASGTATAAAANTGLNGQILGGALEQSNVNLTGELVNMIIAQRDYTANAKTITANDKITDVAVNMAR